MTGKEDLFEKSTSCVDIENDVWDILNFEIMKSLKEENEELKNKLTKYKRAFEILKEILSMHKDTSLNGEVDFYTLYFTGELPYECYKRLTKEEYELLEELMKND